MQQKKPKILFVMQLPPPIHGVSVMNKIIKDSRLINEELHCDYINLATAKNINDLQKTGFHKYITTLKILAKAFFKMAGNRYRYVYITVFPWGFAFVKDSLVVLMARLFGLKPLLHLHTYGFKRVSESSGLKRRYYRFVFKNTRVICLSDLLIEDIENLYRGPVFILPNGIPQVNFENTYNNAQEPVTLLYLSNLIRGKGILVLLDAVELIKQKGYKFKLRVAGPEGNVDYATLKNRILEKGLVEDVKLLGPKFGEEKFSEFRNAGIFIMASDYDTFGLVYLEAMQFGVPCIGANIGGVPDVLGGGRGVIIPEITAEALASAIIDLLKDPGKRFSISETGFNYFKGNFTVDVFEQRLKNILMDKPDLVNGRLTR